MVQIACGIADAVLVVLDIGVYEVEEVTGANFSSMVKVNCRPLRKVKRQKRYCANGGAVDWKYWWVRSCG